jgi:hypothetical protein
MTPLVISVEFEEVVTTVVTLALVPGIELDDAAKEEATILEGIEVFNEVATVSLVEDSGAVEFAPTIQ